MRPLLMSAGAQGFMGRLAKAFEEAKHPRHPKGSAEGGQFMPKGESEKAPAPSMPALRERAPEHSPARRAVDAGLALGAKAHALKEKYFLEDDELLELWSQHYVRDHYGHWQEPVPGHKVLDDVERTLGDFMEYPWNVNAFDQAYQAAAGGLKRLRYVRGWRYGALPSGEASYNYRDQHPEAGISLMEATEAVDDDPLPGAPADWVSAMFIAASGAKKVWVEGWLIPKRGSDGEPLIVGAKAVKGTGK